MQNRHNSDLKTKQGKSKIELFKFLTLPRLKMYTTIKFIYLTKMLQKEFPREPYLSVAHDENE